MYIPYNIKVIDEPKAHYDQEIHNKSQTVFAESQWHEEQFKRFSRARGKNVKSFGSYKFESFDRRRQLSRSEKRKSILIAPHWTFRDQKIAIGDFDNYRKQIDTLPILYPNLTFFFRPHPSWSTSILKLGLMSDETLAEYIRFWQSQENCNYVPNMDIDKFSDISALITDSGSFIAEFLPTLVPMYLLHKRMKFNDFGQAIANTHYTTVDFSNSEMFIQKVVLQNDDPKIENRRDLMFSVSRDLIRSNFTSSLIGYLDDLSE